MQWAHVILECDLCGERWSFEKEIPALAHDDLVIGKVPYHPCGGNIRLIAGQKALPQSGEDT